MATKLEMQKLIEAEIMGLSSEFSTNDYARACDDASRELGWSFPVTSAFKTLWMKNRAKRHLVTYYLTEAAVKFRVKTKYLNQKFDQLFKLVKQWDQDFEAVMESRPEEFANVSSYKMFGTKIDAGFAYDPLTGRDITYDEDQEILFDPTA